MKKKVLTVLSFMCMLFVLCAIAGIQVCAASQFSDVSEEHWAYNQISELVNRGILSGYEDGTFKPNNDVTRAEWATIMTTAFHLAPPENIHLSCENNMDLGKRHWAAPYMLAAEDYLNCYRDDNGSAWYYPENQATREQVAVSLVKYKRFNINNANISLLSEFDDNNLINEKNYMSIAVENEIISGYEDNTLRPQNSLTRAEAAALIYRIINFDAFKAIDNVKLNNLYIGQSAEDVINILGEPDFKSETEYQWFETYYQEWQYLSHDVVIRMSRKGDRQFVNAILAVGSCSMLTESGIGIGSTSEEVINAYRNSIGDGYINDTDILIGSEYGGIDFTLNDGKVAAIYIGSMRE